MEEQVRFWCAHGTDYSATQRRKTHNTIRLYCLLYSSVCGNMYRYAKVVCNYTYHFSEANQIYM